MKKYLIALLSFFVSFQLQAEDTEVLYKKANAFYQKNDYKNAITEYEKIIQSGFENADLYYNLGNAYYKLSEYKSAILNYERAKRLAPQDEDILFNLKLANLNVIDKVEPLPQFFMTTWWNGIADLYNVDEWAVMNIITFCIAVLMGVFFLLTGFGILKKLLFFLAIVFLGFSGLLFAITQIRKDLEYNTREAIIFAPNAYIKSSPSDKSTDLFILHEGIKVKMLDHVGTWVKIRLANGTEGWILLRDVQAI